MMTQVKTAYLPRRCNSCGKVLWFEEYVKTRFVGYRYVIDSNLCKYCADRTRESLGLERIFDE